MNCVVTGGAGFIGSYIADDLIEQGHDVLIIDDESGGFKCNVNPKARWLRIALEDLPKGALNGVQVVYHFAAFAAEGLSFFTPTLNAKRNFVAFARLISESIQAGVETFVFASSMAVYGKNPQIPFSEDHVIRPSDPYGITKAACEQMLRAYAEEYPLKFVIIRPHNVYGIRQNLADPYRNVIGIFLRQILNDQPLTIFGDGKQTRAFSHISDIVSCIVQSAFIPEVYGRTINLGSGKPRTILDVVATLEKIVGQTLRVSYLPPRPADAKHAYCTTDLSQRFFGFQEKADFEVGLSEMLEWAKTLDIKTPQWQNGQLEITKGLPEPWQGPNPDSTRRGIQDVLG